MSLWCRLKTEISILRGHNLRVLCVLVKYMHAVSLYLRVIVVYHNVRGIIEIKHKLYMMSKGT